MQVGELRYVLEQSLPYWLKQSDDPGEVSGFLVPGSRMIVLDEWSAHKGMPRVLCSRGVRFVRHSQLITLSMRVL